MYKKTLAERFEGFSTNRDGLTSEKVKENLEIYGENVLDSYDKESIFVVFFRTLKDVLVAILILAAIISFSLGNRTDAYIILFIVIVNSTIGTVQYIKSQNSLNALKKMSPSITLVRRDGEEKIVRARDLVPGDIVIVKTGDIIPADGRLIESVNLFVDESALTGESNPVEKDASFETDENLPLGDRINMLYSSTIVTNGRAEFIVISTGMKTEIGKIAFLISEKDDSTTPLQNKLNKVGIILATIVVLIAIGIFVMGVLNNKSIEEMFFISVSMAVAAIPEGLSAIVTIILSVGVLKLSKENAIVRRLPSVETLGSASVICSDKTGTLTENKMKVNELYSVDGNLQLLMQSFMLCNDSYLNKSNMVIGEPMEASFVTFGIEQGIEYKQLIETFKRVQEISFDSNRKMMTTLHEHQNKYYQYTKGGIDEVISVSTHYLENGEAKELTEDIKEKYINKNDEYTSQGIRVLASAYKTVDNIEDMSEDSLIFLGIISITDPPRESAKESIAICKNAGITTIMITGDHLLTAKSVATELGILDDNHKAITGRELDKMTYEEFKEEFESIRVYARVNPEHKVRIVNAWKEAGHVVAMTGDGVNDAPALKNADIGVAMGITGTDVTRDSSDLVLMDDKFSTIVKAVEEGRKIFINIEKTIRYLLSCNLGEILLLVFAMALTFDLPLIPVQILWVNLVSDSFPALAIGVEPRERDLMQRGPKGEKEGLLTKRSLFLTIFEGLIMGGVSFLAFYIGSKIDHSTGMTMAYLTIAFSQLFHSVNMRFIGSLFNKNFLKNYKFFIAFTISTLLVLITVLIPEGRELFKTVLLSMENWLIVLGFSVVPLVMTELRKLIIK